MEHENAETVAAELRDVERRRLAGLREADMSSCESLHAADYELITPGGATLSKQEYLGQIADGSLDYRRFDPEGDIAVRVLGPSAAVLRYQVAIEAELPGGHDADRFWHTDIYERLDGRWQAVWSQATRIRS
jgi:Domain of unknown function (DUF4440)